MPLLNPFDMVYDKLIELARRSPALQTAIPRSQENITSENEESGIANWEAKTQESGLPDLRLNHSMINGKLNIASNCAQIDREYRWLIREERKTLNQSIHRVEWALLCHLVDCQFEDELRKLEWGGHQFCKVFRLANLQSGDMDTERTGIVGWASIATITIGMTFPQSTMRQFAQGVELTLPTLV